MGVIYCDPVQVTYRSAGTSPRNIALRKWLVSSYDCRLLTSISFLQEHVQKGICSKATKKVTKRVLPKAEAPKQALPKEEAIKKVLPKATEAIRKVLSKASHICGDVEKIVTRMTSFYCNHIYEI